jgi:hypothetical protein
MMRGTWLRSVAELLGHQSMKMTMRYAHLSPALLSAEVSLLDPPPPEAAGLKSRPTYEREGNESKRARKGQFGEWSSREDDSRSFHGHFEAASNRRSPSAALLVFLPAATGARLIASDLCGARYGSIGPSSSNSPAAASASSSARRLEARLPKRAHHDVALATSSIGG